MASISEAVRARTDQTKVSHEKGEGEEQLGRQMRRQGKIRQVSKLTNFVLSQIETPKSGEETDRSRGSRRPPLPSASARLPAGAV